MYCAHLSLSSFSKQILFIRRTVTAVVGENSEVVLENRELEYSVLSKDSSMDSIWNL